MHSTLPTPHSSLLTSRGFTTIEKLIVGGIIGLLLIVMATVLWRDARTTRDVARLADMAVVANWLEVGFADALRYPSAPNSQPFALGVGAAGQLCLDQHTTLQWLDRGVPCSGRAILPIVPRDPSFIGEPQGTLCLSQEVGWCDYTYVVSDDGKDYQIRFAIEGPVGGFKCAEYPCMKTLGKDGVK